MLINDKYQKLNWNKNCGLLPVIVQHVVSGEVLMLGYVNKEAISTTEKIGYVTFFSRSKNRLWTKGESSGNILKLINWYPDCDKDALLFLVLPKGPTCHKNKKSCFYPAISHFGFLYQLENIISEKRKLSWTYSDRSYTSRLYTLGIKRIAQKVGEEGLETALAAISPNSNDQLVDEASDLIYHLLVLLQYKSLNLEKIIQKLRARSNFNDTCSIKKNNNNTEDKENT